MRDKKVTILLLLLMVLYFFVFSLSSSQAAVTLIVGDGSGAPGSTDNPVAINLDNPGSAKLFLFSR